MTAIRHTTAIPALSYRAGHVERLAHSLGSVLLSWAISRTPRLTHEQQSLQLQRETANSAVAHGALRLYQLR